MDKTWFGSAIPLKDGIYLVRQAGDTVHWVEVGTDADLLDENIALSRAAALMLVPGLAQLRYLAK